METAAQAEVRVNECVLLRRDEAGIATLTLNRPDKFNALSVALLAALQRELDAIATDRGVRVVARTLRDAGMDVIYTGLHRTPEEVVNAAVQEDVDILGVSLLSGVQMTVFPKIFKLLDEKGVKDMIVVAGGVMPDEDVVELKKMGVAEVMLQDTPPDAIVATLTRLVEERGQR